MVRRSGLMVSWLLYIAPAFALVPARLAEAIDQAAKAEMDRQKLVGLAVGIVSDNEIVYLQGYGFANPEAIPDRVVGYLKNSRCEADRRTEALDPDVSWKLGGGGYNLTVEDFARFPAGLLKRKLVSEKTEQAMWTTQCTKDGTETAYGLGFSVQFRQGDQAANISHTGAQQKTRTGFRIVPKDRLAVVVMTNSEYAEVLPLVHNIERAVRNVKSGASGSE